MCDPQSGTALNPVPPDAPRTVRLLVKDKAAVQACARQIESLAVQRVILLHNSIIDVQPKQRLREALSIWD